MSDFPVQSGDFSYSFSFTPKTGVDNWVLNLAYQSGSESLFSAPSEKQVLSGISGASYNVARTESYLFLTDTGSGHVEVFENTFLNTITGNNVFNKINRITGSSANVSFGKSLTASGGLVAIGDPNKTINSISGVGEVFYFQDYLTGGEGATGTSNFSQMGSVTGEVVSGNFGSSLSLVGYPADQMILCVGATGQQSGSGNAYIYDTEDEELLQTISPSGNDINEFGKSSAFTEALSLKWLAIGYNQGGTGNADIYKETAEGTQQFEFFQKISGKESGDMFGYSIDPFGSSFAIGAPNLSGGSGAAYIYDYNTSLATFVNSQTLAPAEREAGDNFGKNVAFDGVNGIVTSNHNSGKGYLYHYNGSSWQEESTVSGQYNTISGSFGGDISGSHVTVFEGNVLVVGSSKENFAYYFTTGQESQVGYTGLSISGSGGKLYDSDGNFIYGYNRSQSQNISGSVFTGGYYTIFANGYLLNSNASREAGVGNSEPLNYWTMTGQDTLENYMLQIKS